MRRIVVIRLVLTLAFLLACRAPATRRPAEGFPIPLSARDNPEGMRVDGAPVRLQPARQSDSALVRRHLSALVVLVSGSGPLSGATVRLFPNEVWRDVVRRDTTDRNGTLYLDALAPQDYTGLVHCTRYLQQLFRVRLSSGYVDTLVVSLGLDYVRARRGDSVHFAVPCASPDT